MFRLAATVIDIQAERSALQPQPQAGAFCTFEGWVRDHHQGRSVRGLRYEAFAELAERAGRELVATAIRRFELRVAAAVHRVGELHVGDIAVWIGVAADHRAAAFEACRWLIDRIKEEVPIWKYEHYADGSAGWVSDPLA